MLMAQTTAPAYAGTAAWRVRYWLSYGTGYAAYVSTAFGRRILIDGYGRLCGAERGSPSPSAGLPEAEQNVQRLCASTTPRQSSNLDTNVCPCGAVRKVR